MILVVCHLSKGNNSVCSRNGYDILVCILTNEDAYLYKEPDERYGPNTISIKIGTRDVVLVFCSSSDVVPSLNQVS